MVDVRGSLGGRGGGAGEKLELETLPSRSVVFAVLQCAAPFASHGRLESGYAYRRSFLLMVRRAPRSSVSYHSLCRRRDTSPQDRQVQRGAEIRVQKVFQKSHMKQSLGE